MASNGLVSEGSPQVSPIGWAAEFPLSLPLETTTEAAVVQDDCTWVYISGWLSNLLGKQDHGLYQGLSSADLELGVFGRPDGGGGDPPGFACCEWLQATWPS